MEKQPTCEERVQEHLESRLEDIRTLWQLYCSGDEEGDEDLGNFHEYGLSFDYVAAGTFKDQDEGYFRYQISWGGPSEEFRFYTDAGMSLHRVEFWFMDWWDGASRTLHGEDYTLLAEIFGFFKEIGSADAEFNKAVESC